MPTKTDTSSVPSGIPDQRYFWDQWHRSHSVASHEDHAASAVNDFLSALPDPSGSRVLEIGCGQGREATRLKRNVRQVDALDHSPVAINTASQRATQNRVAINFRQHDVTKRLPYETHAFDGVFSHLSLHYFDDQTTHRIFDDLARVLKPRGILYFTVRSVLDPLFGQGTQVADNMFCRNGHVRHFFTTEYATRILSSWDVKVADNYDTTDRTINPGNFIRVLACAP